MFSVLQHDNMRHITHGMVKWVCLKHVWVALIPVTAPIEVPKNPNIRRYGCQRDASISQVLVNMK